MEKPKLTIKQDGELALSMQLVRPIPHRSASPSTCSSPLAASTFWQPTNQVELSNYISSSLPRLYLKIPPFTLRLLSSCQKTTLAVMAIPLKAEDPKEIKSSIVGSFVKAMVTLIIEWSGLFPSFPKHT